MNPKDKRRFDMHAFPTTAGDGMTLRDWFAGQAMAGMLANSDRDGYPEDRAQLAYEYADAMLEARDE